MPDPEVPVEPGRSVNVTIKPSEGRSPISDYIYGSNQDISTNDVWTVRRLGGNRLTGYNWENDFSNAGSDYMHSSDTWLIDVIGAQGSGSQAAKVMTTFHDQSLAMGAKSLLTLQLAGYVAADGRGAVSVGETASSNRWVPVVAKKNAPFETIPSRTDGFVYMDEFVNFMVDRYGGAATDQGVRWYALDNEPGLWAETHPRIHPEHLQVKDLIDKSVEMALAVKAVDPDAKIVGPALYGMGAFDNLQGAPDWDQERIGKWFIDYYLDNMRRAEETHGMRLLDVLDVHWYPEAQGDNRIVFGSALTEKDIAARLQAPRTLWDADYIEDSWIGQWKQDFIPLLPELKASIETYYPGTELAITEYNYGAANSISGGLAQVDVLGVFSTSNIHIASLWTLEENNAFISAGFNLYRNYDGQGGMYGNTNVRVELADKVQQSVYASIQDEDMSQLHIIAINKDKEEAAEFIFNIDGGSYTEANGWYFDATGVLIRSTASPDLASGNTLTATLPPFSATHFVLR